MTIHSNNTLLKVPSKNLLTDKQQAQLDRITEAFTVSNEQLDTILAAQSAAMANGLAAYGNTIAMIPVYVVGRITGNEVGTYLALDLGGTHLRICAIHLQGCGKLDLCSRKFTVPDNYKTNSTGKVLFDYLAKCIRQFIDEETSLPTLKPGAFYSLGFTFSYPVHQLAIDRGTLITWTKGFNLPDVVDKDVAQLLQSALYRHNLPVKVKALINDTAGCLLAHAYRDPTAQAGIIIGTGNNAAYYERVSRIGKLNDSHSNEEMIINTEWGAFDTERKILPQTRFDVRVDRMSPHPFKQPFEKMVGGQYLGELLRLVLLDFIDRRLLFDGHSSDSLNRPLSLDTKYLSMIEGDTTDELTQTQHVLEAVIGLPAGKSTLAERRLVQHICTLISTRSARLCATGLAALISLRPDLITNNTTNTSNRIAVGIDGSLFEWYPHYADRMTTALKHHLKTDHKVVLSLTKDGSVIGAALACLLAEQHQ
ncbi:hexokinase-domain-containing protein [Syncephalis fuscata]|nr:hexokinase-domain-containing protein [Syncephalis fuscata]KAI9591012.1 hexokinase-domain-containing protein [Syncephalis fuscata]